MSRNFPDPRQLRRREATREPRTRVIVICEGELTEPHYLREFAQRVKNPLISLEIVEKGGGVRELVQKVLLKNRELASDAKRRGSSFDSRFKVWGMPDVDEHQKLLEAKNLAKEHQLNIALSNPCFEIWGILHFERYDAPVHRHDAQRYLRELMPKYSHDKSPKFDMALLCGKYSKAKQYAQWLLDRRKDERDEQGNPSTNVFELLDVIAQGSHLKPEEI